MSPVTLDGTSSAVLARGVDLLERFNGVGPKLLVQNFGVAIAVLMHRAAPGAPVPGPSRLLERARLGALLNTGDLQTAVCDPTWEKAPAFLPVGAQGPIHKPFTGNFKGRSPQSNNWRNSFDLQAGLGCDAPSQLLTDPTYLGQPRFDCRYRDPTTGECWSPDGNRYATNRTCFNPNKRNVPPGPGTRAQHRPKLLARGIDADGKQGYWVVEPTVDVLADLLADPAKRVPVYPFAAALYGGSPYFSQWGTEVSRERLERDLALGVTEFVTLFDLDPSSRWNAAMLQGLSSGTAGPVASVSAASPVPPAETDAATGSETSAAGSGGFASGGTGASSVGSYSATPLSEPVPYKDRGKGELQDTAGKQADPARRRRLLERANEGHRRTLRAVVAQLEEAGYTVDEQLDGYDLCSRRGAQLAHLFEVKTWTSENLAAQVRAGWAQLHEYRYRNRHRLPDEVRLYLVLDREPPSDFWAWRYLAEEEDVLPCWEADGALGTLGEYEDRLPPQ